MSTSTKRPRYTTAKGVAFYPSLRRPEVFEGKELGFTIKVIFDKDEQARLESFLLQELEKAKSLPEFKGKKWKNPMIGMGETKDGDTYFKFKMGHQYTSKKTGETIKRTVPIYDATGKILPENVDPKHGSTVIVAYTIMPYINGLACGLSLRLEALQVIDLKEFNTQSADSFGFGVEEGGYQFETAQTDSAIQLEDEETTEGVDF